MFVTVLFCMQTVAKLTADNLVFLMNLKKAEAELAAANQEKLQLRLAAEKQRGPWFDEVRGKKCQCNGRGGQSMCWQLRSRGGRSLMRCMGKSVKAMAGEVSQRVGS